MERLNLRLIAFDAGDVSDSPEAFADRVAALVEAAWDGGADAVLLPELLWMGLERFVPGGDPERFVAGLFRDQIEPGLIRRLARSDRLVVLGSVPRVEADGTLRNSAPVLCEGRMFYQDKIHLTPWESAFAGGGTLRVFRFRGVRMAVVICLDAEIPEVSAALRGMEVDLLLVPSATDSLMGVERVGRCANARAVELGCGVAVCHLLGRSDSRLVDENTGRLAFYLPSQSAFSGRERITETGVVESGVHALSVVVDLAAIRANRAIRGETDPSRVTAVTPVIEAR